MDWLKKLENIKKFYQEPGFVLPEPGPTEQDDRIELETYGWDFMSPKSTGPREGSTVHEFKDALTEKLVPELGVNYNSPKGWSVGAGPWAGKSDPSINFQFRKEFDDGGVATPKRGLVDGPGSYSKTLSKETVAKRRKTFFDNLPDLKRKNQIKWEKANPKLNFYDVNVSTQDSIRVTGRTDLGTLGRKGAGKFSGELVRLKNLNQRYEIDAWLKDWIDNNFKNYGVRDKDKFLKDLKKDWKKAQKTEFKNNRLAQTSGDLPTTTARNKSVGGGKNKKTVRSPDKVFSIFDESLLQISAQEKDRFYRRLFYAGQIDTNPELKKDINNYFKTVLADKKRIAGLSEKKIDELSRFLAKNSDVAYILGADADLETTMKQKIFGSRFKDYDAYREKVSKASVKYLKNIKKLEEITGIPIRQEMRQEQTALKKILNVKELPVELRYSIDHLYGISEAVRNPKDKVFAKQVAENLMGGTVRQNTVAGLEGYSVRRKSLINNISKGKNVTKSLARLNELTTEFYPQFKNLKQPYKIVDGKLTFAKGFKGETQQERFKSYFKEIDKTKQGKQLIRKEYGSLRNLIKAIGCPNNKAVGGRVGFKDGTSCFDKGKNALNSGNFAKGAQARNAAKFLNRAYKMGKWVWKWGVIPEAVFSSGDALLRMGYGATLDEGLLRATDYLFSGNQTLKADVLEIERQLGGEAAEVFRNVGNWKDRKNELESIKQQRASDHTVAGTDFAETNSGMSSAEVDKYWDPIQTAKEKELRDASVSASKDEQILAESYSEEAYDKSDTDSLSSKIAFYKNQNEKPMPHSGGESGLDVDFAMPYDKTQAELNKRMSPQNFTRDMLTREPEIYHQVMDNLKKDLYPHQYFWDEKENFENIKSDKGVSEAQGHYNLSLALLDQALKKPLSSHVLDDRYTKEQVYGTQEGRGFLEKLNRKKFIRPGVFNATSNQLDDIYDMGRQGAASGGIAGVRRPNAIAPESGPAPQGEGLSYLLNRVREW